MELGQRLRNIAAIVVVADGPGLRGMRNPRNPSEVVVSCAGTRAAPDLPLRAVPMLNECVTIVAAADERLSHGPDAVCRDDGHSKKDAGRPSRRIRAGDDVPTGAVPLLGKRVLASAETVETGAYSPDIVSRDDGYSKKDAGIG